MSTHHAILLAMRCLGGLGALVFGYSLLRDVVVETQQLYAKWRGWTARRRWVCAVELFGIFAQILIITLLIVGRKTWIGAFAASLAALLTITIPCSALKWNRRRNKPWRNALLLVFGLLFGWIGYSIFRAGY